MKDLQYRDLQESGIRNVESLAIIQTCKKVDGEVLQSGTIVANGCIDALDHDRFGLKVRFGAVQDTDLDLSRGAALGLAMDILENYGVSPGEFASWIAQRKSTNAHGDASHWFLVG